MGNKFIRNYIAKKVAGRSDDGIMITLSDPKKINFQVAMMEDLLMRNGIDPRAITSENQFKGILNLLESVEKGNLAQNIKSGITGSKSAKIFDLEGKEIPKGSKIMGGKAVDDDLPPPGSRGGDEDIAAPVQSQEETLRNMTEAEIKANLEAQNKKGIENILKRKNREDVYGIEDYDTTNMSEIKKEIIRTETKLGNLNPDDPNFRAKAKPLIDKITALQKKLREDKADGGRIGYFMGSPNPLGTATIREMLKFFSKGSSTGKTGSEMLQLTNPKSLNKLLMDPNIYRKFDIKKGIAAPELIKSMQSQLTSERKKMLEEILGAAKNIQKADESTIKYKNEMIDEMIAKGVDRNMAEDMAAMLSKMAENVAGKRDTPKLSKEGILQLETILKNMETGNKPNRKLNADGGRIGFKDGMTRRTFLKILGGAVSIPIIGKFFKPVKVGKTVKKLPVIQTDEVAGKPEWFDQLVNKVILEGDDVTKKLSVQDRQVVHNLKVDDMEDVTVYRNLDDGEIRVSYDSPSNMGEQSVDLVFKPGMADETTKGKPADQFYAVEVEPRGIRMGPDDYDIEFDGENLVDNVDELMSDTTKLKSLAGKNPTMKEIVEGTKKKKKVQAMNEDTVEQAEYLETKYGPGDEGDPNFQDFSDYASGGIARMLGE